MATGDEKITLAKLRQRAGMTQRQLADKLGVTVGTVSDWERNVKEPRPSFLQVKILIETLNCTLDELVEATSHWHKN
ncbi:helix-turn-helix transcriptional regulator [Leptolyngbya sp. NK1-12]|uniref:Helix-turn-helix transcriptional regulator n=1 Tax=Leptolyngbya sp. NK1-12 TaxID=2547451 RepID=A0AA97AHG9_9CYAN|nr:helix-turn-helix transcriptional regulator [Leptolyngbya sp. NK1-12]WNZ22741.1 helix-turn-helix transcriptional regulator [Leptolyngbya sp. NK1-12]